MSPKRWSLAGRLTAVFAIATLVIVIANAAFTAYFLRRTIEQDLDDTVREELAIVDERFFGDTYTPELFQEIVATRLIGADEMTLAWRVWNPDTGAVWGDFGETRLLTSARPTLAGTGTTHDAGTLRWRAERLRSGYVVAVVVESKSRFELLSRYETVAVRRVVISAALAALVSWFFLRRFTGLLRKVADDLRAESSGDPTLQIANPPREIEEVADALRERLARVRTASEQAQLFTAGLAHELRSPIQNLIGETEVALMTPRDAATYRSVLESNLDELRELGDAVDNLLTICSQRSSDSKVLRQTFDLGDEAEIRLEREKSRARLLGVELDIRRNGDTTLVGDREALLRALRNLAGNAVDFSPRGERVEVSIDGAGDAVRVVVDDRGPGVPPDLSDRIFEPFFTGPAKRGGRVGYGLGLAITRAAVIAQGGTIEVARNAAGGASFRVELPRRPGRRAEGA